VLASGSADNYAYLFDLGLHNEVSFILQESALLPTSNLALTSGLLPMQVTGEFVQKLEGHSGRVYAVHFHPSEPLLASASADHSIKVMNPPSSMAFVMFVSHLNL